MPAPRTLRLLAALAAVAVLTTACGDDDDAADDPTVQPDDDGDDAAETTDDDAEGSDSSDDGDDGDGDGEGSCALVTLDELEDLFGSPFDPGDRTQDDVTSGDQCTWANTDAPPVKVVSVVHYDDDGLQGAFGQSAEAFFDLNREALTVDEELDLGDESFRSGSAIWARDGDDLYNVLVTGTSDEALAGLRGLAEIVVDG